MSIQLASLAPYAMLQKVYLKKFLNISLFDFFLYSRNFRLEYYTIKQKKFLVIALFA